MTLAEYQNSTCRTAYTNISTSQRILNFTLGLTGEAGEVAELVKKVYFHGRRMDLDKVTEELGDVLWYVAALADACGLSLEEVAKYNVAKLQARYPHGFTKVVK